MSNYTLESCSFYNVNNINRTPVVVFEDHNMALPVWGDFSAKQLSCYNLITFDSHTDTHQSFSTYLFEENIKHSFESNIFNIPQIKELLNNCKYHPNDFVFEDVLKLSVSYIRNTEHILTAYAMKYIKSYTIIHRSHGYEEDDRLNGFNARYIHADDLTFPINIETPFILDFDLDYFRNAEDLNNDFFDSIANLVKNASVITIAREPRYFEDCRNDESFTNKQAEKLLLSKIESVLNN